jgi:PAS domain S-box-containing protein
MLARVTELDALNKQLQASEQRFRHLFEASPMPMWLLNADDRQCVAVNQAALSLYGFARDEFMQLPRNAPPFAAGAAIAGTNATWHRTKSGAAIAVELHMRAVELGVRRGEIYAAYDFTQRVFSDQAMAHAADAFQTVLVAAPDGLLLLDENFAIVDVNEAYCRMSGYDRDEVMKLSMNQLEARIGEEPQTRFAQWRAAEQAGAAGVDKSRYDSKHVRKDGSQYSVEVHLGGVTGAKPRTVVSIRDSSARAAQHEAEIAKHHEEQRLQTSRAKVLQHALLLHRMALVADEAAIVRRAVEFAAEITESPLAFACSTDPSQITAQLLAVFDQAYGPATSIELEKGKMSNKGPSAHCMRSGQPVFC